MIFILDNIITELVIIYRQILRIWRYLAVFGGIGRYWAVLGGIGRYWAVLGGICGTNSNYPPNKGPTYLKEGLCTSDRAYVVQRGPTNVL